MDAAHPLIGPRGAFARRGLPRAGGFFFPGARAFKDELRRNLHGLCIEQRAGNGKTIVP